MKDENEKEIYVVIGYTGEYSSRSEHLVCAFTSYNEADQFVDDLNKLKAFDEEIHKKFIEFQENYLIDNPNPRTFVPIFPDEMSLYDAKMHHYHNKIKAEKKWIEENRVLPANLARAAKLAKIDYDGGYPGGVHYSFYSTMIYGLPNESEQSESESWL